MVLIKEIYETISVLCKTYNVRIYFNDNLEMVLTKFDYNELAKTGRGKTDIMYEKIYNIEDLKTSLPLETLVIIFSQEADRYFDERDSRKYLKEFEKLEDYLIDNNYVYERIDKVNSSIKDEERDYHQLIAYTKKSDEAFDVVISKSLHSYGYEKGLLELSGCLVKSKDDNSEGFLTADDIIKRLENE